VEVGVLCGEAGYFIADLVGFISVGWGIGPRRQMTREIGARTVGGTVPSRSGGHLGGVGERAVGGSGIVPFYAESLFIRSTLKMKMKPVFTWGSLFTRGPKDEVAGGGSAGV
jgi:hypothetical protein